MEQREGVRRDSWLESEVRLHCHFFLKCPPAYFVRVARSLPVALASCAVLGTVVGTFDYNGQGLAPGKTESIEERRKRFFKHPRPSPSPATAEDAE